MGLGGKTFEVGSTIGLCSCSTPAFGFGLAQLFGAAKLSKPLRLGTTFNKRLGSGRKNRHFLTPSPPRLDHIVIEGPLRHYVYFSEYIYFNIIPLLGKGVILILFVWQLRIPKIDFDLV